MSNSVFVGREADKNLSAKLKVEANEIVDYIANHITLKDLRESFLRSTAIRAAITEDK